MCTGAKFNNAAATAWFAPLPPQQVWNEVPRIVSPGLGSRFVYEIRSWLADPTTRMEGRDSWAPDMVSLGKIFECLLSYLREEGLVLKHLLKRGKLDNKRNDNERAQIDTTGTCSILSSARRRSTNWKSRRVRRRGPGRSGGSQRQLEQSGLDSTHLRDVWLKSGHLIGVTLRRSH